MKYLKLLSVCLLISLLLSLVSCKSNTFDDTVTSNSEASTETSTEISTDTMYCGPSCNREYFYSLDEVDEFLFAGSESNSEGTDPAIYNSRNKYIPFSELFEINENTKFNKKNNAYPSWVGVIPIEL